MEIVQVQPLRRRPLQPKNIQWDSKPRATKVEANAGKENCPFGVVEAPLASTGREDCPFGAVKESLAEELQKARRRRERLRAERERTERVLREREGVLERGIRETEMRWEQQKKLELEFQRVFRIMNLSSCVRDEHVQSLRAKEEEKKDVPLEETSNAESAEPLQQDGETEK